MSLNREEWMSFLETSTVAFFFLFFKFYGKKLLCSCRTASQSKGERRKLGNRAEVVNTVSFPCAKGLRSNWGKRGHNCSILNTELNQAGPDDILSQALLLTLAFQFKTARKPSAQKCAFLSWLWATFLGFDKCGRCQLLHL